jgi:UPF0271 protein
VIAPLGDHAITLVRPPVAARALVATIREWPGVVDVVVTADVVAVYFAEAPVVEPARLAALAELPAHAESGRTVELPARYDGEDLDEVARITGIDVARVHAAGSYVVDMMGFQPGFAYLVGLAPQLALARRPTPRARVPAGAIAIAGGYTGVYPFASPGGWHLIGRVVDIALFGPAGPLLAIGDRVKFVP